MMIEIEGKIVSTELFRRKFICDISKCKGICCYEGDAGAPLEEDELEALTEAYPAVRPMLTAEAVEIIEREGLWTTDQDGDLVTPIIGGRECVFALKEADGTWTCAIEKAHLEGKVAFRKPISCHLYPIRVAKYAKREALNFHEWEVCKAAVELGERGGVAAYKFLKEPIVRKYGESFYAELELVDKELQKQKFFDRYG